MVGLGLLLDLFCFDFLLGSLVVWVSASRSFSLRSGFLLPSTDFIFFYFRAPKGHIPLFELLFRSWDFVSFRLVVLHRLLVAQDYT